MASVIAMKREKLGEKWKERPARPGEKIDFYQARWKTPDYKTRKKNFDLKRDADRHAAEMEGTKVSGSYIDPSAGRSPHSRPTPRNGGPSRSTGRGTADQIETRFRRHVYPRIGGRAIGAIKQNEIQALVKWMATGDDDHEPLAPATVKVAYDWLSTVFKAAVVNRDIPVSPCRDIKLPNVDKRKVRCPYRWRRWPPWPMAFPERYRTLIVLGAGSGVRISEALGVTSDRIDWPRQNLNVDRQLRRVEPDGTPVFGPVKDKKNRPRTIPLSDEVTAAMVEHVRTYGTGAGGLLFTNDSGEPIRRTTFSEMWARVARPLGIPVGDGYHQLRHFYASVLIRGGASITLVQEMLGHASLETTQIYAHLFPDSADMVRASVDRALRSLKSVPSEELPETSSGNLGSDWGPIEAPSL